MEISVGTYSSVRYLVEVRYWECPLIESPLYVPWLVVSMDKYAYHIWAATMYMYTKGRYKVLTCILRITAY